MGRRRLHHLRPCPLPSSRPWVSAATSASKRLSSRVSAPLSSFAPLCDAPPSATTCAFVPAVASRSPSLRLPTSAPRRHSRSASLSTTAAAICLRRASRPSAPHSPCPRASSPRSPASSPQRRRTSHSLHTASCVSHAPTHASPASARSAPSRRPLRRAPRPSKHSTLILLRVLVFPRSLVSLLPGRFGLLLHHRGGDRQGAHLTPSYMPLPYWESHLFSRLAPSMLQHLRAQLFPQKRKKS